MKTLSDQVALMEHQLNDAEGELKTIRGILLVSFCEYENRKKPPVFNVWESLEKVKGMSTTQMFIEAFDALVKREQETPTEV